MRSPAAFLLVLILAAVLVLSVTEMPRFGHPSNPAFNELPARVAEQGPRETGALNLVAAVMLDYRALDTLVETVVLFAALGGVMALLAGEGKKR